jgi:uncharacterized protein YjbJ (UPF0337 family)
MPLRRRGNRTAGAHVVLATPDRQKEDMMDKDRIEGSIEQGKGKVKEVAGKVTGDTKTEAEGKAQQAAGKVQNAVGGLKDKAREALKQD